MNNIILILIFIKQNNNIKIGDFEWKMIENWYGYIKNGYFSKILY